MDGNNFTGGGGTSRSSTPGGHLGATGSITNNVVSVGQIVNNATTTSCSAAKVAHVKTTLFDSASGSVSLSSLIPVSGTTGGITTGTLLTNATVPAIGAIKLGSNSAASTSTNATPVALNTPQIANSTCATSIRTLGTGGQSTQVRVVMGNLMTSSMIKQLENANPVRAQITAFSTTPTRSLPNTTISVSRPNTQMTYLPRANITASAMTGVGVGMPTGQRLVTPTRASSASAAVTGAVSGITSTGNFARGTSVSHNNTTPSPTVLSPGASTTWMAANPTGQVQLIRAIPQQARQRNSPSVVAVSGKVLTTTTSAMPSTATIMSGALQTAAIQGQSGGIQTVSSGVLTEQQQQQTYVATVLPSRQHQATLVYSSNVATSQPLSQPQPFIQASVGGLGPRLAVATPLTATIGVTTAARQIRPIPLGKSFSATKLNTTNISIRTPNLPQLTPAIATGVSNTSVVASAAANSPRCITATASSNGSVLPSNLSTTRIIQLQQPPGSATQQIIGATGRLATNVMLQPIIVNTTGGNKLGLRSPVTMAAKVQPSLTITQLGIGKLPSTSTSRVCGTNSPLYPGSGNDSSNCSASPSITAPSNLIAGVGGQMLPVQNSVSTTISSSINGAAGSSGATIVPLAISTRSPSVGNFIAGAMTPIKNPGAITVGKIMSQPQLNLPLDTGATDSCSSISTGSITPTNVFIHHAAIAQRPSHCSSGSNGSLTNVSNSSTVGISVPNTSTVGVTTAAFLQSSGAIYYEPMLANTVHVCNSGLSIATPTLTNTTTISKSNHISSMTSNNLATTSLPFPTHASIGGNASTATFTVVPSSGGRTIGQVQIPVSNAGTHIQTIRFSQLPNSSLTSAATDALTVSQTAPEVIQQSCVTNVEPPSHIIIPATQRNNIPVNSNNCAISQHPQHMIIPLQTSIKMTAANGAASTAVVSNFLKKRGLDGTPVRAAKNLQPTLLSMSSAGVAAISPPDPSIGSSYNLNSGNSLNYNTTIQLTAEALAKKNRTMSSTRSDSILGNNTIGMPLIISNPCSPVSSDGSTTVSANSSPGIDQQMKCNNLIINRMPSGGQNIETHFHPINEFYLNHSVTGQYIISGVPVSSRKLNSLDFSRHTSGCSIPQPLENIGQYQCSSIKKSRRATVDNQLSITNQNHVVVPSLINASSISIPPGSTFNITAAIHGNIVNSIIGHDGLHSGKENTNPVEYILRRPPNCTLLSGYKQTWKSAYNHFQRYTDVKPREERKPTVMDLANQSNISMKINGWKIHHLRSQMEDLCENENLSYQRLSAMLHQMESDDTKIEMERITELLKGNMQRSKIIADGLNEAQHQIMKIFDHKAHISDIINRCASKRNFKRREKAY